MPRRQNRGLFLCACEFARPASVAARTQLSGVVSDTFQVLTVAESVRPLGERLTNDRSGYVVVRLTNNRSGYVVVRLTNHRSGYVVVRLTNNRSGCVVVRLTNDRSGYVSVRLTNSRRIDPTFGRQQVGLPARLCPAIARTWPPSVTDERGVIGSSTRGSASFDET